MNTERTLSIIKPDAVSRDHIGEVYRRIEKNQLQIVAAKMLRLSREQAESLYAVHKSKHFYEDLVQFMISGPVMVQVLEGENAIHKYRELMGATIPKQALPGTIRYDLAGQRDGAEVHENIVHGSDSADNARAEIEFFFRANELCPRPPETPNNA